MPGCLANRGDFGGAQLLPASRRAQTGLMERPIGFRGWMASEDGGMRNFLPAMHRSPQENLPWELLECPPTALISHGGFCTLELFQQAHFMFSSEQLHQPVPSVPGDAHRLQTPYATVSQRAWIPHRVPPVSGDGLRQSIGPQSVSGPNPSSSADVSLSPADSPAMGFSDGWALVVFLVLSMPILMWLFIFLAPFGGWFFPEGVSSDRHTAFLPSDVSEDRVADSGFVVSHPAGISASPD